MARNHCAGSSVASSSAKMCIRDRLPGGRVLIVGGETPAANYSFAEIFDPANETFTPVANAPTERRWLHAALTLADGSVLIVGGENDDGALASIWRFDVGTRRFVAQAPLTAARSVARAVVTPDDEVLLYLSLIHI